MDGLFPDLCPYGAPPSGAYLCGRPYGHAGAHGEWRHAVVLDPEEAVAVTEEAVTRDQAANPHVTEELLAAIERVAARAAGTDTELTADDFWLEVGTIPADKGAASAMGPAIRRARARGLIVATGDYALSARPKAHRKPLPVYIAP